MTDLIRIGTRGSELARWQADHVAGLLRAAYPDLRVEIVVIHTKGDEALDTPLPLIGGKGVFTAELESALRDGKIDLAVHSLKDLPTDDPDGLAIGAVPHRAPVNDALVSRNRMLFSQLPAGAKVGTSSRRRSAQLLTRRPDLTMADIRGNVPTRIQKVLDGAYEATVLAQAGLERLGRGDAISEILPLDVSLPAPGQGALSIQCRDEAKSLELLEPLDHVETRVAVTAERAFLAGLGGGCSVPVAAYCEFSHGVLRVRGRVCAPDGSSQIDVAQSAVLDTAHFDAQPQARQIGEELARRALQKGASLILEAAP